MGIYKIFRIIHDKAPKSDVAVAYTTTEKLHPRLTKLKTCFKNGTAKRNNEEIYNYFNKYGTDAKNLKTILLESVECVNLDQVRSRVYYWTEALKNGELTLDEQSINITKSNTILCECGMIINKIDKNIHLLSIDHRKKISELKISKQVLQKEIEEKNKAKQLVDLVKYAANSDKKKKEKKEKIGMKNGNDNADVGTP